MRRQREKYLGAEGERWIKSHWRLKRECNTGKYCGVFYFVSSSNEEMEEKTK